ncbi:DUF1700 domain-containing protein [Gudongella sp. DL1XJH-153]|uniref:DUF1700 domain-containing protein n=1 Tax=Gudongella sp. DL1XJH-153 TaxID=3409804 RepID=UPI003BB7BF85
MNRKFADDFCDFLFSQTHQLFYYRVNSPEYLKRLRSYLAELSESELREVLLDYEEHFNIGRDKGKTDDEISAELGSPKEVAESILSTIGPEEKANPNTATAKPADDGVKRFLIILLLLGLNIVFLAGPAVAVLGVIVGIFGAGIGFVVGGVGLMIGAPFTSFMAGFVPGMLTSLAFGIGLSALGALVFIFGIYLSKLFYRLASMYIEWNKKVINS